MFVGGPSARHEDDHRARNAQDIAPVLDAHAHQPLPGFADVEAETLHPQGDIVTSMAGGVDQGAVLAARVRRPPDLLADVRDDVVLHAVILAAGPDAPSGQHASGGRG